MAQARLEFAVSLCGELTESSPDEYHRIFEKISRFPKEVEGRKEAARRMRIPYDPDMGIHVQDDVFLTRAGWD